MPQGRRVMSLVTSDEHLANAPARVHHPDHPGPDRTEPIVNATRQRPRGRRGDAEVHGGSAAGRWDETGLGWRLRRGTRVPARSALLDAEELPEPGAAAATGWVCSSGRVGRARRHRSPAGRRAGRAPGRGGVTVNTVTVDDGQIVETLRFFWPDVELLCDPSPLTGGCWATMLATPPHRHAGRHPRRGGAAGDAGRAFTLDEQWPHFRASVAGTGREDLDDALERLVAGQPRQGSAVICHGDFHPFNLLAHGTRTTVLDWTAPSRPRRPTTSPSPGYCCGTRRSPPRLPYVPSSALRPQRAGAAVRPPLPASQPRRRPQGSGLVCRAARPAHPQQPRDLDPQWRSPCP